MRINTLQANITSGSYPIYIGNHLFDNPDLWHQHLKNKQVLIVSDENVGPLYADKLQSLFSDYHCELVVFPAGEKSKSWDALTSIIDKLVSLGYHRDCTVIALGGGVVGDLAGFAAACYQRGVQFFQVPTTLLAQVDASVGGKTAINHADGKNLIGAFHQPAAVFCDLETLNTLPEREFKAGLAEVIKHALIADADFFEWLELNLPRILAREPQALALMIERAVRIKIALVEADTQDVTGKRACLNFGHTFGHAIEVLEGYGHWLHGEAVAIGMIMATKISIKRGLIDKKIGIRLKNLLTSAGLPIKFPKNLQETILVQKMFLDKKNQEYGLTLILLDALGSAVLYPNVDSTMLRNLITEQDDLE